MSVWFTHILILSGFKSSVKSRKLDATKQLYCTLSLCCNHGPSWTAYLPPSLHYSHHSEKWTQTGIDSVWVHRPTAFTRRGPEHLNISLAFFFFFFDLDPVFLSLSISRIDSDQNFINCFIIELLTSCLSGCSFPKNSLKCQNIQVDGYFSHQPEKQW